MHLRTVCLSALLLCSPAVLLAQASPQAVTDTPKRESPTPPEQPKYRSHSRHGAAFNQGPRQFAVPLRGIGNVHFPVTTVHPEAQKFFNQGINLLYSFFYFEAERAFRHAAMLDPDCAMAYWGLARTDGGRAKEFLKLARQKMDRVTERERRYIEAESLLYQENKDEKLRQQEHARAMEKIVLAYPEDIEAKAMLAWTLKGRADGSGTSYRTAIDALLKAVLAKNPMHPGAHHYRIHLWDSSAEAEEALESCRLYPKAAWAIGHAQHMPGHIYAQLGRWEEAAYAMDAAARVERRYFYTQGRMPWDSWNYAHDQHYLIANLGYIGRIREGLALAQELLEAPRDPKHNNGNDWGPAGQGRFALMRMHLRGERWDAVLNATDSGWREEDKDEKTWKFYTLGLAHLGKGNLEEARKHLKVMEDLNASGDAMECARLELRGRIAVMAGDFKAGLEDLKKAAKIELDKFKYNDPSPYPRPLYEVLAWGYLKAKQPEAAIPVLREGLMREPNNGFALCQLLEALLATNQSAEADPVFENLRMAWKNADADLPLPALVEQYLARRRAAGQAVEFRRPYRPSRELERLGPARWQPFPAPAFALTASDGKTRTLADFKGKPLLLVFYLGGSCSHCMTQLTTLGKEKAAFEKMGVQMVAVSPDTVDMYREFLSANPNYPFLLLSDPNRIASRLYKARDDFENLDLHVTVLIDGKGRVWWFNSGSEPFEDVAFLEQEIGRMNAWDARQNGRISESSTKRQARRE
jgi:peroxiredoxin